MKYLIILFLPLITSCNIFPDNPENEMPEDKPFLKKYITLNDGVRVDCESPFISGELIIYFISEKESNRSWITAYDKESLEVVWMWNDAFENYGAKGYGQLSYLYRDILCISQGNLSYGIDVKNGETLWHQNAESGYSIISGFEENIFKVTWNEFSEDASIMQASIHDGKWEEILSTVKTDSFSVRYFSPIAFEWQGENYISFVFQKQIINPFSSSSWLNLYSTSKDELVWVSDTIPTNSINGLGGPGGVTFYDGQLLLGNKALYSYNIEDGSLEWWKYYGNTFSSTRNRPKPHNGKLYANNESHFLVALDIHTGNEYFNVASGGLCSQMQFYDGKVFETSWANNKLFGFDANQGEKLYEIDAPFYDRFGENDDLWFENSLTIDPETGLAYTSDSKHLLVYEFD